MTILQVAGEDESFKVINGSVNTDPVSFRADYARCSIRSGSEDGVQVVFQEELKAYLDAQPAGDKDFWIGYRFRGGGGFLTSGIGMKLYDSAAKPFFRLFAFGPSDLGIQLSTDGFSSNNTSYPASAVTQFAPS